MATARGAVIAMGVALREPEAGIGAAVEGAIEVAMAGAAPVAVPIAEADADEEVDIMAGSWTVRCGIAPVAAARPVAKPAAVFRCRLAVMHT